MDETESTLMTRSFIFYIYSCTDADECAMDKHNCSSDGDCANVMGSYQCTCNPGFTGDGKTCQGKLAVSVRVSLTCVMQKISLVGLELLDLNKNRGHH